MIIIAALFLAINTSVFAGICDNKSSQFIDNGEVHLIYPNEKKLIIQ